MKAETKFKVGDKVRYVGLFDGYKGKIGVVEEIDVEHGINFYRVRFGDHDFNWVFSCSSDSLELVTETKKTKPKRVVVIEITDDGAKAMLRNGKTVMKQAEIKRHHSDAPSDREAAIYAVGKLFGDTVREIRPEEEKAAWASKTAEILRKMDWNDILFKAFINNK